MLDRSTGERARHGVRRVTTEPEQHSNQNQTEERGAPARALSIDVATRYVDDLRASGSPLVASAEGADRRRRQAERIVLDVVAILRGEVPGEESRTDPPLLAAELSGDVAAIAAAFADASQRLFRIALPALLDDLPGDVVDIASALTDRLAAEGAALIGVLAESRVLAPAETEVIDRFKIAEILTEREVSVFELLLQDAPVKNISRALHISPHTAKHHITNIGRKLTASGRVEVLRRARELGLLVAVPATVVGAAVTDAIAVINTLL